MKHPYLPLEFQIVAVEGAAKALTSFWSARDRDELKAAAETLRRLVKDREHDIGYRIAKIEPKPGDLFVVTAYGEISPEQMTRIDATIKRNLPGVKVMVLSDGLDVTLMSAKELRERLDGLENDGTIP